MYQIIHYLDSHGRDHYQEWLDTLRDRQAKVAILHRVARLLACGGNKRSQNRNITADINMLQDWKIRNAKNRPLS